MRHKSGSSLALVASKPEFEKDAAKLASNLAQQGFDIRDSRNRGSTLLHVGDKVDFASGYIAAGHHLTLMEQAMRCIPFRFEDLELLVEGESKEVRLLTEYVVVERLKPTVYSFTHNRYGHVDGTDLARVRFSAEIFRRMEALPKISSVVPRSAFLGLIDTERGPALVQRRVDDSNLEIRVKRYHIGSPLHRYLYTERHPSWQSCGPLERWSRFDEPIVCYDWRHPLKDDEGRALADEPVSDDYAAVWVKDVLHAKEMARATFLWLESMMDKAGLVLVDICVFIDRSGKTIFGEISPDCMRIRSKGGSLDAATSFDKDVWRGGAPGRTVAERYWAIFELLFGDRERLISTGS